MCNSSLHFIAVECESCRVKSSSGCLGVACWAAATTCAPTAPTRIPPRRSHGSRPSSRIGALHGPSAGGSAGSSPSVGSPAGGSPPLLATGERAARHAELSAERRRREEAEAASKEAERLAALVRGGGV